jgi:hypothetical protein
VAQPARGVQAEEGTPAQSWQWLGVRSEGKDIDPDPIKSPRAPPRSHSVPGTAVWRKGKTKPLCDSQNYYGGETQPWRARHP